MLGLGKGELVDWSHTAGNSWGGSLCLVSENLGACMLTNKKGCFMCGKGELIYI